LWEVGSQSGIQEKGLGCRARSRGHKAKVVLVRAELDQTGAGVDGPHGLHEVVVECPLFLP
jgi:hypothetical protein